MTPANLALRIDQGATFRALLRLMQPNPVYKPITDIAPTGPVRLTVEHGLPGDWPVWVEHVRQLPEANRAPLRQLPHMAQVVTATELDLPGINATGTRPEGGQLVYRPPLDLTDATAELRLYEKGAEVGTLPATVNAGGRVDVELTAAETAALDWAGREYVLDVTLPNGDVLRAYTGAITVDVAGAAAGQVCHGAAVVGGDRGQRGAQVVGSTFDEEGRLIMTLDDGSMVASDPSPVVETVIQATDTAVAAAGESVSASNAAAEARNEALAASVTAGEKADQSANSASEAAASESVATTKAFEANADADRAETARDASLLSKCVWPTTAAGIGQGVAGTSALVAGSGGTNGTFDLAFSGGTQVLAPKGRFVVEGGAVTQVIIDYPGYYSAGTPTISFAASSGLTGASVSAVMGPNTPVGAYFSTPSAEDTEYNIRYRVAAGPSAVDPTPYPSKVLVDDLSARLPTPTKFSATQSSTWLTRLRGPDFKIVSGTRKDGSSSFFKINIPTNSILTDDMGATGEPFISRLVPALVGTSFAVTQDAKYCYKLVSENNKRVLAIPRAGWPIETKVTQAVVAESVSPGAISPQSLNPELSELIGGGASAPVYIEEIGVEPSRSAFVNNSATGQRSQIPGTDVHNTEQVGNSVAFDDDSGTRKHITLSDPATPYRAVPTTNIACYGDSLTAWPGSNWPVNVIGSIACATATNRGVAGQTSTDVACRQGGIKPAVTVTSNQIPASGSVSVTAIDPADGWRGSVAFGFVGVLAGVPGTLGYDGSGNWTFTRTTSGSVTSCPAGSQFVANQGVTDQEDVQVLWVGRNNVAQVAFENIVLRDIAAMANQIKTLVKRYVVVSVTNGQFEGAGNEIYGKIISINSRLQSLYPGRYLDLRSYMVNQCIYDLGITPTSNDLANIAADRMPPSIMANGGSDSIHFSDSASTKAGEFISDFIIDKGWF